MAYVRLRPNGFYVCVTTFKDKRGRRNNALHTRWVSEGDKDVFLVKSGKIHGGVVHFKDVFFPQQFFGKKVRLKVEAVE